MLNDTIVQSVRVPPCLRARREKEDTGEKRLLIQCLMPPYPL